MSCETAGNAKRKRVQPANKCVQTNYMFDTRSASVITCLLSDILNRLAEITIFGNINSVTVVVVIVYRLPEVSTMPPNHAGLVNRGVLYCIVFVLYRIGLDWIGSCCIVLDWIGLDWIVLFMYGFYYQFNNLRFQHSRTKLLCV